MSCNLSLVLRTVAASGRRLPAARGRLVAVALLVLAAVLPLRAAAAASPDPSGIDVAVRRDGEAIVVDVNLVVRASPQEAWDVLTDYDHMTQFVSSLTMSRIVGHPDGRLMVAQTSRVRVGPLAFKFDSVREIELIPPREIRSRLVRGDMKASTFTTQLVPEAGATRIINHARYLPDRWIPPVIGLALLRTETRMQFSDLRAEILRREARD
ncbi:MAG TPA: SRPBCC family protein [Casimicrobiaceae bacterium]|nr:SRPBCC family protein [Casimicrobiaceae bacterium]